MLGDMLMLLVSAKMMLKVSQIYRKHWNSDPEAQFIHVTQLTSICTALFTNRIFKHLTFPCEPPYWPGHDPHQDLYILDPSNSGTGSDGESSTEDEDGAGGYGDYDEEIKETYHPKPLHKHTILKRSFATFPPVSKLKIDWGFGETTLISTASDGNASDSDEPAAEVSKSRGITVWDVWRSILPEYV